MAFTQLSEQIFDFASPNLIHRSTMQLKAMFEPGDLNLIFKVTKVIQEDFPLISEDIFHVVSLNSVIWYTEASGQGKDLIRKEVTLTLFSRSRRSFVLKRSSLNISRNIQQMQCRDSSGQGQDQILMESAS